MYKIFREKFESKSRMRVFLFGLGLSNQIQADYCNLTGESDHNQPIDSCFCPSGTDTVLIDNTIGFTCTAL